MKMIDLEDMILIYASKASAEIVFRSYFNSIFKEKKKIKIATARAGNVIGGGDWSLNRLVPDCVRAWALNNKVKIRNPNSTRPWQHVLEPLSGYITLSYQLKKNKNINGGSFNFGPNINEVATVKKVLKYLKNIGKKLNLKFTKEKFFRRPSIKIKFNKITKNFKMEKNFEFRKNH